MAGPRFTVDGSDELEARLAEACRAVVAGVRALIPARLLLGVVLIGDHAMGEGGVLRGEGVERPCADLQFRILLKGSARSAEKRFRRGLDELAERLALDLDGGMEFQTMSISQLRKSPITIASFELLTGHRWLHGEEALFARCEAHQQAERIPLHEATRLLFNRCSGLLDAKARLKQDSFSQDDAGFIQRRCAVLQLGLGDALLAAAGRYHASCRERSGRLHEPDSSWNGELLASVREHHARGVQFRLHPTPAESDRPGLEKLHAELVDLARRVWLRLENQRLGAKFADAREYGLSQANKCPETWGTRNRLVNAKAFGLKAAFGRLANRFPRERLFNALALLLWVADAEKDSRLRSTLQSNLRTQAESFEDLVRAYQAMWRRFH